MSTDNDEFNIGYNDYMAGVALTANPFSAPANRANWQDGWYEAQCHHPDESDGYDEE